MIYVTKLSLLILMGLLLSSCASTVNENEDPLKHSRKLITEGHSSLYKHGAFEVPNTEIKLIPAGPRPLELASEMMGLRARQAFMTSLKNAADSVYIVSEGTEFSIEIASKIKSSSEELGKSVTDITTPQGRLLIDRSSAFGKEMVVESWQFGKSTAEAMQAFSTQLEEGLVADGTFIADNTTSSGKQLINRSWKGAASLSESTSQAARSSLLFASDQFVKGYAAVPSKLSNRASDISKAADSKIFTRGINQSNKERKKYNRVFTNILGDVSRDTGRNVNKSFRNARESLNDINSTGFGLAILQSARWVLQGVLWDGIVEPMTKIGSASIGYIAVNFVMFPTMVVIHQGVAVTNLAIEVTWNTAGAAYDIVAPSAVSAVASVYSLFQLTGGNLVAATTAVGGTAVGAGTIIAGKTVGTSLKGIGYISGKSVQYVGVPLTAAGVTVASGTVGVVAGGVGTVAGSGIVIVGQTASLGSHLFGNLLAGSTVVAGTTASVASGATVGVYELSKAVVVPTGYELGGGIVLSYGTMSHLAAHSILAVSDASYLVLSLEGPRWVLYAVQGKLSNGDDLPSGTVLNLEEMQNAGEEFLYLPVSDQEMKKVVESVYENLPKVEEK